MKTFTRTLAIGLLALTIGTAANAQSGDKKRVDGATAASRISTLSRSVVESAARGRDARTAAKQRFELMRSLAESDPQRALDVAMTTDLRAKLPAEYHEYLESRERAEGVLEVIAECEEHKGKIEYFVKRGEEQMQLYIAGEPDQNVVSGKNVSIDGVKIGDSFVASSESLKETSSSSQTMQTSSLTGTTGEKRVLVILVNFQDKQTQPFTTDHVRDLTFGPISDYYREASYGQASLAGDVYGWYTIPVSSTVCDKTAIANNAKQAAQSAGANLANYNHFVYAFPTNACTFGGSGTVGGTKQVWINGVYDFATVGHELGHNFGLAHSQALDCGPSAIGDTCTTYEYGDIFDLMGLSTFGHFNLFHKERLGWVGSGAAQTIQTVSTSGTYWIDGYVTANGGTKGLKVLKSIDSVTGNRTWYFLERRSGSGFDSPYASNANLTNGVVVHTGNDTAYQSNLLDMTPETNSWDDPALVAGRSFTDAAAGVTITTLSADSAGAWVQIDVAGQPCTRSNPTISVTPGQSSWVRAGSSFAYQVSVTNNDSGGCPSDAFELAASLPSGLSAAFSSSSLMLGNGTSGVATAYVSSTASSPDGTYNFGVSASNVFNRSYAGSAGATYVIVSGLNVAASPGSVKYSRSQTASVTAVVTASGSSVSGASVTFTMRKANGSVVTNTLVTGSDGRAVFSYKFNRKTDPVGTYSVTAAASTNGYSGQAITSFSVTK